MVRYGALALALLCLFGPGQALAASRKSAPSRIHLFGARQACQLPLITRNGRLFAPELVLPDAAAHLKVRTAVEGFFALDPLGPEALHKEGFERVSAAAQEWARETLEPLPASRRSRAVKSYLLAVQSRLIHRPSITTFSEFYDGTIGDLAITSHNYGFREAGREVLWTHTGSDEHVLSVAFTPKLRDTPLFHEIVRVHEWTHVADQARSGLVATGGLPTPGTQPDPMHNMVTEAKAYAAVFELERAFRGAERGLGNDLDLLARRLDKKVGSLAFSEYFYTFLPGHWWSGDMRSGNTFKRELPRPDRPKKSDSVIRGIPFLPEVSRAATFIRTIRP